jgi:hypothetical protein
VGIASKHLSQDQLIPSREKENFGYQSFCIDPRQDLSEDHHLWKCILLRSYTVNPYLTHVLHGLRCGGTRIQKGRTWYVLRPDIDPTGNLAWDSLESYEELRDRYLKPHLDELIDLLKQLTKEITR